MNGTRRLRMKNLVEALGPVNYLTLTEALQIARTLGEGHVVTLHHDEAGGSDFGQPGVHHVNVVGYVSFDKPIDGDLDNVNVVGIWAPGALSLDEVK